MSGKAKSSVPSRKKWVLISISVAAVLLLLGGLIWWLVGNY
jgi:hypothetical protein